MSVRSCHAYQRFSYLSKSMFSQLKAVAAQTAADASRLQTLGAQNITVSGSLKIDIEVTVALRKKAEMLAARWSNRGQRRVLIAASTHQGEDEQLLDVLQKLRKLDPQILLVLVPRHSQRFEVVKKRCLQQGYHVRCHSEHRVDENTDIIIGDTIGELMLMYGASDIAFFGGSLVDNGGHNILEPAAWGLPIVIGPSVYNFVAIVDGLLAVKGICLVNNGRELLESLTALVENPAQRHQMGQAAYRYIASNKGALEKLLRFLEPILYNHGVQNNNMKNVADNP
jgi:3-deoxy-D-manno-octulosonic-acid transferase